jgi:hypothetical protein
MLKYKNQSQVYYKCKGKIITTTGDHTEEYFYDLEVRESFL